MMMMMNLMTIKCFNSDEQTCRNKLWRHHLCCCCLSVTL